MSSSQISVFSISQATTATLVDVYINDTSIFFIQNGSKKIQISREQQIIGDVGDIIILPPDSTITMENRTWSGIDYKAIGMTFPHEIIKDIFSETSNYIEDKTPQLISPSREDGEFIVKTIQQIQHVKDVPEAIVQHRLIEPLIWLKSLGVKLSTPRDITAIAQVRSLIETDLERTWRSEDVAQYFAMSEATMRRWLAKSNISFSKLLKNARLEKGLSLLQTTETSISEIAYICGFSTPSHFSESFKDRFNVSPRAIRVPEN